MTFKEKYRELCKTELSIPLFSKDWWMDAVCSEGGWDVLLVEEGGSIRASMCYSMIKRLGFKYITQPTLTKMSGVYIKYPSNQKYSSKIAYEKKILNQMIASLKELNIDYYSQNYHYNFTNWLPFYWAGFKQTTCYSYILEDLSDINAVYNNFEPNIRTQIKKASKILTIKENCSVETFYNINKKSFERQKLEIPYSLDFLRNLDSACENKNCRKIFYAQDEEGNIHSAIYIVWDTNSAYYLMGGSDPEFKSSEASTLLIWEAIKFSCSVTKKFDFEGSMIESIERVFRSYGATQKQYFNLRNTFNHALILNITRNLLKSNLPLIKIISKIKGSA